MRLAWAVVRLVLSGPFWVIGLALWPFYAIQQLCYRICSKALFGLLVTLRRRQVAATTLQPGSATDLLRKQRLRRRHVNHRRPVLS